MYKSPFDVVTPMLAWLIEPAMPWCNYRTALWIRDDFLRCNFNMIEICDSQ
jgi:hypothetical protein